MRYPPMKSMERKSAFPHIVVIIFLTLLLLGAVGLFALWNTLEQYEKTTPQHALRSVVSAWESHDIQQLERLCETDGVHLFDEKQYEACFRQALGTDRQDLRFSESNAAESGAGRYRIFGATGSLEVELRPQADGGYAVYLPELPVKSYFICLPQGVGATVNGRRLTEADQADSPYSVKAFRTLEENRIPKLTAYKVSGFVEKPTVALVDAAAEDYCLLETEEAFLFTHRVTEETEAEYAQLAEQTARTYALYVSKDLEFAALNPLLYEDSDFYNTVRSIDRSWYIDHQTPEFLNLEVSNIAVYSEDHFTAEVRFDFKVVSDKKTTQVMKSGYCLAFLRTADGFRLANLEFI